MMNMSRFVVETLLLMESSL
ncbi:hypothetical protein VCHENC02_0922A, partial [Vibrio harveyi]